MMSLINVLLVDDEKGFTEFLREYLKLRGFHVEIASCGEKALELLTPGKFDVVLLDLKMAGLDGQEVMKEIKKTDEFIEIIFVSAYNDAGRTKNTLLKNGAFDYIEKPIKSLNVLKEVIRKAVKKQKERKNNVKTNGSR